MFYTTNSQIESSLLSLRKLVSETRKRTTSPQTSTTNLDLGTCEKLWLLLLFSFSFPLPLLYEVKKRKWKEIKRLKDICRKKNWITYRELMWRRSRFEVKISLAEDEPKWMRTLSALGIQREKEDQLLIHFMSSLYLQ